MDPQITTIVNILNNPGYTALFLALVIWSLVWKGLALWRSAQNRQRNWFIIILLLNTFGILEIMYLFYFSKSTTKNASTQDKTK